MKKLVLIFIVMLFSTGCTTMTDLSLTEQDYRDWEQLNERFPNDEIPLPAVQRKIATW